MLSTRLPQSVSSPIDQYLSIIYFNRMDMHTLYFYTCTINDWIPILSSVSRKSVLIESLRHLVENKKLVVYAFVVMPNHFHAILEMIDCNGKESPIASFKKFTGHRLKHSLNAEGRLLDRFKVDANDRVYEIWQPKSRAVHLYSPEIIYQKLDYIHHNPVSGKWNLADDFTLYEYSSASFYYSEDNRFGFLTHIRDRI